ncbi:MAG: TIGR01212 family radical SAM protein [Butyricicoccus sp.]
MNPFPYSTDNKRYHTYSYELKRKYGGRVARVPLDAGFTCPNRDGAKSVGGCAFCSARGSGDQVAAGGLAAQYEAGIRKLGKWPDARYIPYLQAFSNTYAPVERLKAVYEEAISLPGAVGLAIATRADCIDAERADLLAEYAAKTDLTVELGLQTIHDRTNAALNRGEGFAEFERAVHLLRARGISVWAHLIDGLPGETRDMMVQSVRVLGQMDVQGVKIHLMHYLRGTVLEHLHHLAMTREDYVAIVCDQLEVLPAEMVIGRLTGDGPAELLLAPLWSRRKREVLNAIDQELARRDSWQGKYFSARPRIFTDS